MKPLTKISVMFVLLLLGISLSAYDSGVGQVIDGPVMHVARSAHSATRLQDGSVLIAGGMVIESDILDSTELYDPQTETFMFTGSMLEPRVDHTASLLTDGRVLIVGGWGRNVLASAEIYDPKTGTFTATGAMASPRSGFTETLLPDGRVLIVGGYDNHTRQFLDSAEIYDPSTGQFTATGQMSTPRLAHSATLLEDGRVLIMGGGTFSEVWSSAELYDPKTQTFTEIDDLAGPRYKHGAARLPDGRVLILGGSNSEDWNGMTTRAEVFDPETQTFALTDTLEAERFKLRDAVAVLDDGRILIAGGSAEVELYDPMRDTFVVVPGRIDASRFYTTATALDNGQVLIAGGYDRSITGTVKTWLFQTEPDV